MIFKKINKYFDVSRHRSKNKTIILILLLALFLRLTALGQSLWLDEAVQVWASSHSSLKWLLFSYLPGDFNPPFYHLLMHFWIKMFGTTERVVRLPSVILGLGSVWLAWKIGKEVGGKKRGERIGLVAALLLATSPLHIYYSQEARMYMLAAFGVAFSAWRFLKLQKEDGWCSSIWLGIGFLLMGFSHFLTLLTLPVFLVFGLGRGEEIGGIGGIREIRKIGKKKKKMILPFVFLGAGYLAYWPLFLKQLATGLSWTKIFPVWGRTVGSFGLKAAALLPVKFIIGRVRIENRAAYALTAGILVLGYWAAPIYLFLKNSKSRLEAKRLFVLSLLVFPPVLGIIISFWVPVFAYFRFLYLLPFFYLMIAMGLEELGRLGGSGGSGELGRLGKLGGLGLALAVGVNLVFSGAYLFGQNFHRENWRGMAAWLERENRSGAPVVILPQIAKPFEYYDKGRSQIIFPYPLNQKPLPALMSRNIEVFLVSYGLPIFDPNDKIRGGLKNSGYRLKSGRSFRKVGIEKWEKKQIHGTFQQVNR